MKVFAQDPREDAFVQDPYRAYRTLPDGPVWWEAYGFPVFHRHDAVTAIFKDARFGRENPIPEPTPSHMIRLAAFEAATMLEREPPVHTRLRGLVARAFTPRAVAARRPAVEALAEDLAANLPADVDLIRAYAERIPVLTIAGLLGAPAAAADQMLAWSHDMVSIYEFNRTRAAEEGGGCGDRLLRLYR